MQESTSGGALQQEYRIQTLRAEVYTAVMIPKAFSLLRSADIEPILVKGWAAARLYPESGLRPLGDLDLCVTPDHFSLAKRVLGSTEGRMLSVDLHNGCSDLDDTEIDELYARSKLAPAGDSYLIRLLGDEDHLRLACLHLLRHGAYRPLWLCDVAAAVEKTDSSFDWDRCLSVNGRRADYVACTISLSRELLGAEIRDAPREIKSKRLPGWLVAHVLKNWSNPAPSGYGISKHAAPMKKYLRHPNGLIRDLSNRWPDALAATMSVNGPLNDLPRLPFQIANGFKRAARFLKSYTDHEPSS